MPPGNTYVPVTMRGELPQLPQCGAWAFLQSIFPGRIFGSDDSLMRGTMDMLDANQREGLIFGTGWIADGIWNYAASFYAHAHLWLGHGPKAAATLYAFGNHASPLLCWREEQNPVGAPGSFVGDMPHNWASAEFIRLVRHLVILERGDELHLLEGLPQAWAKPGAELRMVEVPTSFGDVSLVMKVADDGRSAQIIVHSPGREPPAKMVVHLEGFERPIASVTVDGAPLDAHQTAVAPQRSSTITVTFESVRSAFDMPNRLKTYFEDMSVAKPFVVRTGESWEAHRRQLRAFLLECVGLATVAGARATRCPHVRHPGPPLVHGPPRVLPVVAGRVFHRSALHAQRVPEAPRAGRAVSAWSLDQRQRCTRLFKHGV